MPIAAITNVDLDIVTADGHYRLNGGCTNVPVTGGGWEQWSQLLVIHGLNSDNTTQIMPIYWNGDVWIRTSKSAGAWNEWRPIATATKPQEYDLPLAAGLVDVGGEYRKNQFGEASACLAVTGSIAADAVVATLPPGYRPARDKPMPVTGITPGGMVAGYCVIRAATGEIINKCGAVTGLIGFRSYVAAS